MKDLDELKEGYGMKKNASLTIIIYLIISCSLFASCSDDSHKAILKDRKQAIYIQYKDCLDDFNFDSLKRSANKNDVEYEFRIFERPDNSCNYYYYDIKIYSNKASDVSVMKFNNSSISSNINWKNYKVFEYSGQLSDEETQKFLSVIEETGFWDIPDEGVWKKVTWLGKEEICIDGYGNKKSNCVVQSAEEVKGNKDEKIQEIHFALLGILAKKIEYENFYQ